MRALGLTATAAGYPISMFALVALLCFVLALFHVSLGSVDLVVLGFCFVAVHLLFSVPLPLPWRRG